YLGWAPADAGLIYRSATRPVGIGLLVGGAVVGVALILPMVRAAFAGMGRARAAGGSAEELPVRLMFAAALASVVLLTLAASWAAPIGLARALATALLATLWLWLAGIIVAQCTGLTDWSPLSGLALIAVTIVLLMTRDVVAAITIGIAVCVATSHAADMMTDLKTGHLVGSQPLKQQKTQLATVWIGPLVSIAVLFLIQHVYGIGNAKVPAPQAQALQAAIQGVQGGNVPYARYAAGALIGGLLTLAKGGGIGVLVGLSMYLPIAYILPYGLGCVLAVIAERWNRRWADETGLPIAAGLLVGDSLAGVVVALVSVGLELWRRSHP
ncbi:MAG TPA: OPT/YSL family transporter, partial [Polyangia bacterium]|nr:OPT/YSL family transporter [Polyangia bacterium]